ncbi:ATP-binding protein [Speluncibacter jeojiensis]|uniref:histidine kinase n=1 Tax=Speluncibacter jeojiensis TaxID=2710754 RepID=A0A9X4LZV6_9ACTN|nr:ATP-binding protein [Corynebacteriales bacterium D3-21]
MVTGSRATHALTGPAEHRVLRMAAALIAAGYLAFLVVSAPLILTQRPMLAAWYTPVAVTIVFGPPLLLVVAALRSGPTAIRRLSTVVAATLLVAAAFWLPALHDPAVPDSDHIWLLPVLTIATVAAAIGMPPLWAIGYLLLTCPLLQFADRQSALDRSSVDIATGTLLVLLSCGLSMAAAIGIIHSMRLLDRSRALTRQRAAEAAAAEALAAERERIDALIHDSVLSTLLDASRRENDAVLTAQAGRALDALDRLRTGVAAGDALTVDQLVTLLRASATEIDEDIVVQVRRNPGSAGLRVPHTAATTIGAALAEAVRNVVRHADRPGAPSHRSVEVSLSADAVLVDVVDDGPGFDPDTVRPHRLGLRVSIRGRMRQLPGGHADVHSSPGAGTRVRLGWRAQP